MSAPFDLEVQLAGIVDSLGERHIPYALWGGLALAVHGFRERRSTWTFWLSPQPSKLLSMR
jgi:hypothetical protein